MWGPGGMAWPNIFAEDLSKQVVLLRLGSCLSGTSMLALVNCKDNGPRHAIYALDLMAYNDKAKAEMWSSKSSLPMSLYCR